MAFTSSSCHTAINLRRSHGFLGAINAAFSDRIWSCGHQSCLTLPVAFGSSRRYFAQKHKKKGKKSKNAPLSKHQKKQIESEQRMRRLDKMTPKADNISKYMSGSPIIPPALLSATASPYVFCAKIAVERANIDPRTLFSEFSGTSDGGFVPHTLPPGTSFHSIADYKEIKDTLPRVAFLGRSNVGKSSLLNALVKRKNMAVTSKQPGRTQSVYFYAWELKDVRQGYLVDLPGYGYAVGPDKAISDWQRRTQQFLLKGGLTRLYLLQDTRVEPTSFDHTVQGWLEEAHIPYTTVFTKVDGVRPPEMIKKANQVCMRYQHQLELQEGRFSQSPMVHITSAKNGNGLAELWSSIEADALAADAVYVGEADDSADEQDINS